MAFNRQLQDSKEISLSSSFSFKKIYKLLSRKNNHFNSHSQALDEYVVFIIALYLWFKYLQFESQNKWIQKEKYLTRGFLFLLTASGFLLPSLSGLESRQLKISALACVLGSVSSFAMDWYINKLSALTHQSDNSQGNNQGTYGYPQFNMYMRWPNCDINHNNHGVVADHDCIFR